MNNDKIQNAKWFEIESNLNYKNIHVNRDSDRKLGSMHTQQSPCSSAWLLLGMILLLLSVVVLFIGMVLLSFTALLLGMILLSVVVILLR